MNKSRAARNADAGVVGDVADGADVLHRNVRRTARKRHPTPPPMTRWSRTYRCRTM
jgi:hypothetical protein